MPDQRNSNTNPVSGLVRHFEALYQEHMCDLPIVNRRIVVESVGFRSFGAHELGVLITPWFMNLVLLPSDDTWCTVEQGDTQIFDLPSGPVEFTVSRDCELGTYLTAVLRQSVADLPDQPTARRVAMRRLQKLFLPRRQERTLSRRQLLTGLRGR